MNKKIIWVFAAVLLVSFIFGQGETTPTAPEAAPEVKYDYDKFKEAFDNDPTSALVEQYPNLCAEYFVKNPNKASEVKYHDSYETMMGKDIKYLNQNKAAFEEYAKSKYAPLKLEGNFKSFDETTGKFETKGLKGETGGTAEKRERGLYRRSR